MGPLEGVDNSIIEESIFLAELNQAELDSLSEYSYQCDVNTAVKTTEFEAQAAQIDQLTRMERVASCNIDPSNEEESMHNVLHESLFLAQVNRAILLQREEEEFEAAILASKLEQKKPEAPAVAAASVPVAPIAPLSISERICKLRTNQEARVAREMDIALSIPSDKVEEKKDESAPVPMPLVNYSLDNESNKEVEVPLNPGMQYFIDRARFMGYIKV